MATGFNPSITRVCLNWFFNLFVSVVTIGHTYLKKTDANALFERS